MKHNILKKKIVIIIGFLYFPLFGSETKELCQFVPIMNGIQYENGPIVELCVAQQSRLFKEMCEDIPIQSNTIIPFNLNCDVETAWTFASCLTKQYEAQQGNVKANEWLSSHIKELSLQEKIYLSNIADYTNTELNFNVCDAIVKNLVDDFVSIDKKLFSSMNSNVKKQLASYLIARNHYDTDLLQAYITKLLKQEYLLEREGIIAKTCAIYYATKKRICYFDKDTNTIIRIIKKNKKINFFCVSQFDLLQRKSSLALLRKKIYECIWGAQNEKIIDVSSYDLKRIISIDMNNDETCFICSVFTQDKNKKNYLINIADKSVTETNKVRFDNENNDVFSVVIEQHFKTKRYTILNKITQNSCRFVAELLVGEIFLYNKNQIIRKKKEDYKDKLNITSIVSPIIDDTMRNFVKNVQINGLPLLMCDIARQKGGHIALNSEDYIEYENLPKECRSMVDALYVITKDDILSRFAGVLSRAYRIVFPWVKAVVVVCACAMPVMIISVGLSYYNPKIKTDDVTKVIEFFLKL